jgi:uncharacterized protein YdhG (YjbR/CyaY superfamily)
MKIGKAKNIDGFISAYPKNVQVILQKLRQTIREEAPGAQEKIAYGIPTFTYHGNLVHFSAYEKHIGFYPGSEPIKVFQEELKPYETSKGTVRFPINKPLPYPLIRKMVAYVVKDRQAKYK